MIDTVLFDLDGTLLNMTEKEFVGSYFSRLAKKLAPCGYEKEPLIQALWAGTKDMVMNDGSMTNREAFWKRFDSLMGENAHEIESMTDDFYANEFDEVREVLRSERDCGEMIRSLSGRGYTVALATNPLFPPVAVRTRLAWIGLVPEDFALVTDYTNCSATKPNPMYYKSVLSRLGKTPDQCLMVGNSTKEDGAAASLGIRTIIVTDSLEGGTEIPGNVEAMTFDEACKQLGELPDISK